MAIKDVKEYYYTMQAQYLEMKADLADFEAALRDGFITEDQLQAAVDEVAVIERNYNRLTYIMYLLEVPNRCNKKTKFRKATKNLHARLVSQQADLDSIKYENYSALDTLRKELKKLK